MYMMYIMFDMVDTAFTLFNSIQFKLLIKITSWPEDQIAHFLQT